MENLSRRGVSGCVVLQPLCSQLGHDELLIVVLEQIGSSTQQSPAQSRFCSREALQQTSGLRAIGNADALPFTVWLL